MRGLVLAESDSDSGREGGALVAPTGEEAFARDGGLHGTIALVRALVRILLLLARRGMGKVLVLLLLLLLMLLMME